MGEAKTIRVGVIGAGGNHAGMSHMEQLATTPGCELAMLADLSGERLAEAEQRYAPDGVTTTTDWQDVINNETVDAVVIMTPDAFHTEQLLAAVAAGKHVLSEKPLAVTPEQYEQLQSALIIAREKGLVVTTCYPRRFSRPFVNTERLLRDREFFAAVFGIEPPADLDFPTELCINLNYPRPKRLDQDQSFLSNHVSFASDHLPHEVDTGNHFFGFSPYISAVSTVNEELEFVVGAKREDGIKLIFRGNRLQEPGSGFREDWQITFKNNAVLKVDAFTGVVEFVHGSQRIYHKPLDEHGKPLFKTDYDEHFQMLNEHFIRSVQNREENPPYLTERDLLMTTLAAIALQEVGHRTAISPDEQ